jgi:hypothetical protein
MLYKKSGTKASGAAKFRWTTYVVLRYQQNHNRHIYEKEKNPFSLG